MRIQTTIQGGKVSTVAIAGVFETMTIVDGDEVECIRTKTQREARRAHRLAVQNATIGGAGAASYWAQSVSASVLRAAIARDA